MRLGLAFQAFFRVLGDAACAERVRRALADTAPTTAAKPAKVEAPPIGAAQRSEALTLLSTLQREARLVDFLQEPIAAYTDAQIGAAVRDVHERARAALDRMFGLEAVVSAAEGAEIHVPRGFDPLEYRLGGDVSGEPPFRGTLRHHGWRASRCELPRWTGGSAAARVVAPAEVELVSTTAR
jgi:hypothetical protein